MVRWNASMRTLHLNSMGDQARRAVIVFATMAAAGIASSASAQSAGRFVSGPLVWTPTFQIREAGVDSNIFNTPTAAKEDVSGGASTTVNSILTLGLLRATTAGGAEYTYFERYENQRGLNRRVSSHLEFPTRFSPDATISWAKVKERASNEVDTRAPRTDLAFTLGILTRLTSRVSVTLSAGKQKSEYERQVVFRDVELATQLNRTSEQANAAARVNITPLTTLAIDASAGRDQMPLRPEAETENVRMTAGVNFAPDAVIRGHAGVGYHVMQPRHAGASNAIAGSFSGVTSDVNLSYTLLGITRFTGNILRDASYSVSATQPSYVSTRASLDIVQAIGGPFDLTLRAGREKLAYPATVLAAARNDYADVLGGGLQIRVAPQGTLELLYDTSERRSAGGPQFGYQRRRIYTTITYGF